MGFKRKFLSADGLITTVSDTVRQFPLKPLNKSPYSWHDCIMSGLAIFGFKSPSLLQFEKMHRSQAMIRRNLFNLYGVKQAPSDTCLRERLDQINPDLLRKPFKKIFAHLQRGKALEAFRYLDGRYIVSLDGTGQFTSKKIHCKNCCEKKHRNGELTYYHHLLAACIVHPEQKVVIPFAPEPIIKSDGNKKNDCERNAAKRLLKAIRREHPHLKMVIVEDALFANHPHLSLLDELNMDYIIGVKPGDHTYLFDWISDLSPKVYTQTDQKDTVHTFTCYTDVPLNDTHYDYRVNVLDYTETDAKGRTRHFTWVTRLPLKAETVYSVMRAGRSRWRIENETFNTLKNQGYHFEHNYGHGYDNLCSVMTSLMMLAFLIDQVQQLCCKHYQKARQQAGTLRTLFEKTRVLIEYAIWNSFHQLLVFIGVPETRAPPDEASWINR